MEKDGIPQNIIVIIARPDDETVWTGGLLLDNPQGNVFAICLCRASDKDRAPKFHRTIKIIGAKGRSEDFDDGSDQLPLDLF